MGDFSEINPKISLKQGQEYFFTDFVYYLTRSDFVRSNAIQLMTK